MSSLRLIDTREIRYLFKVKITEGILLVFTFVATLVLGHHAGAAARHRRLDPVVHHAEHAAQHRDSRPPAEHEHLSQHRAFPGGGDDPGPGHTAHRCIAVLRERRVPQGEDPRDLRQHGADLKAIILDASAVNDLDSSADTALHQLSDEFKKKGITFYIAGVKAPVRDVMKRSGLYAVLGSDHFFFTIDAAVKRFQDKTRQRQ